MDNYLERYNRILDIEGMSRKGREMAKRLGYTYGSYKVMKSSGKCPVRVVAFVEGYEMAKGLSVDIEKY